VETPGPEIVGLILIIINKNKNRSNLFFQKFSSSKLMFDSKLIN